MVRAIAYTERKTGGEDFREGLRGLHDVRLSTWSTIFMPCRLCMRGWHMLNFDPYYIFSYFSTVFENKYSTVCCGITRTSGL